MNMNITANQPASPMPMPYAHAHAPFASTLPPAQSHAPNLRKLHAFSYLSLMKSTYFLFSGPEQFFNIFQRRASHPLPLREPRFFNADSIDVDASIDRGAQKQSEVTTFYFSLFLSPSLFFFFLLPSPLITSLHSPRKRLKARQPRAKSCCH